MEGAFQSTVQIVDQNKRAGQENLLESKAFLDSVGRIKIPLGKTEDGSIVVRDISMIPHIFVGGYTGTGKTSFVRTMLAIICKDHSSEDACFAIFDSRNIEYSVFQTVPHLKDLVDSNNSKISAMISWLKCESDDRLRTIGNHMCKDIKDYNRTQEEDGIVFGFQKQKIPELFVVLDDLSALNLNKENLSALQAIVDNGRVAGIHVVAVSSSTVFKGQLKELVSSIPCKISFRQASKADSKAIINSAGAETLSISGEMLYKYQSDYIKCQCAYATYENIKAVAETLKEPAAMIPIWGRRAKDIFSDLKTYVDNRVISSDIEQENEEIDKFIYPAGKLIIEKQKASIGMLQRVYKIGFSRSVQIMDNLEEEGV